MSDIIYLAGLTAVLAVMGGSSTAPVPSLFYLIGVLTVYETPIDFATAGTVGAAVGVIIGNFLQLARKGN